MPSRSNRKKRKRIAKGLKDAVSAKLLITQQKELDAQTERLRKRQDAEFVESLEGRSRITKEEGQIE
jgi:hypothetical protein